MGMFDQALAGALNTIRRVSSAQITILWQGKSVSVAAAVGKTLIEVSGSAQPVTVFSRDFIVAAADLVWDGETEPFSIERSFRITQSVALETMTFQVLPDKKDGPPFSWCDPRHTHLRIHTKRIQ